MAALLRSAVLAVMPETRWLNRYGDGRPSYKYLNDDWYPDRVHRLCGPMTATFKSPAMAVIAHRQNTPGARLLGLDETFINYVRS